MKKLEQMTNEELWQLFPIILMEYQEAWPRIYQKEKALLENTFSGEIERISHFGSTSVPGLLAKPTIDILLEVKREVDIDSFVKRAEQEGYLVSVQPENPTPHLLLKKGYTERGFEGQAFHVHVRYFGDWNELYFRDYLRVHEDARRKYRNLKIKLKEKFEHDRDSYTESKGELILHYTNLARKEFLNRYEKK